MPILSNFYGISIKMYIQKVKHNPPHIHALYGEYMFHKIKSVRNLDNYILEIGFENDIIKYYYVSKLFEKWTVFKQLKTTNGLLKK